MAFWSRVLAEGQRRTWTPREKEAYAIVMALRKWAGYIALHPVTVCTDHQSLQSWHRSTWTPPRVPPPDGQDGTRPWPSSTLRLFIFLERITPWRTVSVGGPIPPARACRTSLPMAMRLRPLKPRGSLNGAPDGGGRCQMLRRHGRGCPPRFEGEQKRSVYSPLWVPRAEGPVRHPLWEWSPTSTSSQSLASRTTGPTITPSLRPLRPSIGL